MEVERGWGVGGPLLSLLVRKKRWEKARSELKGVTGEQKMGKLGAKRGQ